MPAGSAGVDGVSAEPGLAKDERRQYRGLRDPLDRGPDTSWESSRANIEISEARGR